MERALIISLKVLAIDIPLLALLGGGIGWLLARRDFRWRELVSLLVQLPIILPPSVLGLYLLFALGRISIFREAGFLFAFPAAVLGALLPSLPIMIQCFTGCLLPAWTGTGGGGPDPWKKALGGFPARDPSPGQKNPVGRTGTLLGQGPGVSALL